MRQKRAAKVQPGMLQAEEPTAACRAAQLPSNRALSFSKMNVCTHTHIHNLNLTKPRKVIFEVKFRLKCIPAATVEFSASLVQI